MKKGSHGGPYKDRRRKILKIRPFSHKKNTERKYEFKGQKWGRTSYSYSYDLAGFLVLVVRVRVSNIYMPNSNFDPDKSPFYCFLSKYNNNSKYIPIIDAQALHIIIFYSSFISCIIFLNISHRYIRKMISCSHYILCSHSQTHP